MNEVANKALVRRSYDEVWAKGNLDVADEVFAGDWNHRDDLGLVQQLGAPVYAGVAE